MMLLCGVICSSARVMAVGHMGKTVVKLDFLYSAFLNTIDLSERAGILYTVLGLELDPNTKSCCM